MRTNKEVLVKGVKFLAYTVILMFSGPTLIYQAFKNQGHPLYYPVLIIGIVVAAFAIWLGFKAINTLMNALFNSKK
jgi:ABC-type enterochelin transport system permease subunit